MNNIQETVKNAMRDNGMTPPDNIILDGVLHRFNDETGKPNSYYTANIDGRAAGVIGNWKTGLKFNWKAEGEDYPKPTDQQRMDFRIEKHRQDRLRKYEEKQRHDRAAQKAAYILKQSASAISHSYLTHKRIEPHNARLYNDALVIPILNEGELVSLQFIDKDGNKRFLTGGKLKGSYSQLGIYNANKPILICEGWATGASLYETTDNLIYVAFSAHKLKDVAIYVRSLYAKGDIIIMGDNDSSGVGQAAAREAALAISGKYLIPETIGHDWNDVINMGVAA
jgi:putative DNA primase/helicase